MIDPMTARAQYVERLMERVREDDFPSNDHLNRIEELLTPDIADDYLEILREKVEDTQFPSLSLLDRIEALTSRIRQRPRRREIEEDEES